MGAIIGIIVMLPICCLAGSKVSALVKGNDSFSKVIKVLLFLLTGGICYYALIIGLSVFGLVFPILGVVYFVLLIVLSVKITCE